jgi:hypothetical protein
MLLQPGSEISNLDQIEFQSEMHKFLPAHSECKNDKLLRQMNTYDIWMEFQIG